MSKLSRRNFLKRIGTIPFMAIPLVGILGAEEKSDIPDLRIEEGFIEAYRGGNGQVVGWNSIKVSVNDSSSISYIKVDIGEESPKYIRMY